MNQTPQNRLTADEITVLTNVYRAVRSQSETDRSAKKETAAMTGYSESTVYKYCIQKAEDEPLEVPLRDFAPDAPVELEEIGSFSKTVEDVEALSSADFEIKPARDLRREVLEVLPDMPTIPKEGARWLVLPDIHVPLHDADSIKAVLEYASEVEWSGCIQLGDLMDWDFIGRFTKDNLRALETRRFRDEYDAGNRVLDDLVAAVRNKNKNAHITILEGNHDWRVEHLVDKAPALEGLIEMESNLNFGERKIDYWRYWTHKRPYILGKAWFIHGLYIGGNHAKKTADNFHRNCWYGHTHDVMTYTKTTAYGDSVMCGSLGTLSKLDPQYMGGRPSNWQQAFTEFFFQGNGNYNHYVTNVIDGKFIAINGKVYGG